MRARPRIHPLSQALSLPCLSQRPRQVTLTETTCPTKENVSAVYSSVGYKLNEKTSLVAGLRYEYLNSVLSSATEHGIVDLHYGKIFPTFYLSRKLKENNTVQFAYSRRIDRPTFNQLAPFVLLLTPDTFRLESNILHQRKK